MRKKTYNDLLKPEEKFQARLVSWIEDHPVLRHKFWFHYPAEGNRTKYEQFLWKVMGCKKNMPDLFFLEPTDTYTGLVMELKSENPYTRTGKCKFRDQEKELIRLRERGYMAVFEYKYDEAKETIEKYFDI